MGSEVCTCKGILLHVDLVSLAVPVSHEFNLPLGEPGLCH